MHKTPYGRTASSLTLALLLISGNAMAAEWPERPLKIIHGGGPGSHGDLISRSVGAMLGERLKQSVVVEPKSGAGQSLAMVSVARSSADGYTLALLNAGIGIQAAVNPKVPYSLRNDFEPVAMVSSFPVVIAVHPDSPYQSVRDLIDAARKEPGKLSFGAIGGTTQHLTGELFASAADIRWTHVPYPGSAGPLTDLLGGRIDAVVDSLTALMGQVRAGKVKALAVTSAKRWPSLPKVPALSETLTGFDVTSWTGLAVPTGTPSNVRQRLEQELTEIVGTDAFATQVRLHGSEPFQMGAAPMKSYIETDVARWKTVVQKPNIRLD